MVYHLFSSSILNGVYYFFDDFFNLNNNWHLNDSFNNFLDYFLNLFYSLLNFFYDKRNLPYHFNLFDLYCWNIYSLLYCYQFLNFNDLFDNHFNFNNFWNLNSLFYYLLDNPWHFYNLLGNLFNLNNLFHNFINIFNNFYGYMNHFFNLFYLNTIYNFLDNSINRHNNRHFNYSLHYLLNEMRNLNSSMSNLEGSKNFINLLISNLTMTHFDNCFINL